MTKTAKSTILPKVAYSWKYLYEWCPRQFRYARVDKVTPDKAKPANTIMGIAVHKVVELMYKNKKFSIKYVCDLWPSVFDDTFKKENFVFDSSLNRDRWYDKGLEILEKTYRMAEARGMLVEPIAVEWWFTLEVKSKLGRRFIIRGKIDLIIKLGNDIWVIDLKTGTWQPTEQELADHSQLTIYDMAVKKLLKLDDITLAFWYPRDSKLMPTKRTERDHEKVINEIENIQFKIEREEFEPTYVRCFLCQYQARCKGEDAVKETGVPLGWFYSEKRK